MKAMKITLEIKCEALSLQSLEGLVRKAMLESSTQGAFSGELRMDDGDSVSWHISSTPVEF